MAFINNNIIAAHRVLARCLLQQHVHSFIPKNHTQLLIARLISKQGFFSDQRLKLDKFESVSSVVHHRYGRIFKEYKNRMESQLDDPNADLLFEDCSMYLYMLEEHDIKNCVRVIQRCNSQLELDRQSGFDAQKDNILSPTALRKCHSLNDIDVALDVFYNTHEGIGYTTSLMLTMDLLFKNQQYQRCAEIASDTIDGDKLNLLFDWFYELAVLSAYRMHSEEGLNYAVKFLDSLTAPNQNSDYQVSVYTLKRIRRLVALYCIDQNHLNAALSLVKQLDDGDFGQTRNIQVLAFLGANNTGNAINIIRKSIRNERNEKKHDEGRSDSKESDDSKGTYPPLLYRDVFFRLKESIIQSEDAGQRRFLKFIEHNFMEFVSKHKLASALSVQILRYYQRSPGASRRELAGSAIAEDLAPSVDNVVPDVVESQPASAADLPKEEETVPSQGTAV